MYATLKQRHRAAGAAASDAAVVRLAAFCFQEMPTLCDPGSRKVMSLCPFPISIPLSIAGSVSLSLSLCLLLVLSVPTCLPVCLRVREKQVQGSGGTWRYVRV